MINPSNPDRRFLIRCRLQNYRSIAVCDVQLEPLMLLVGPNGSGKSNFLDALRLVTESLTTSLEHALQQRGGIQQVRRRSSGHPTHFTIALDLRLPDETPAVYRFSVGTRAGGALDVTKEQCSVGGARYEVRSGQVVHHTVPVVPPASPDRLYLVSAAGLPEFRPLYDALSGMGFYNIQPERIRELQLPDPGEILARDGHNLASVVRRMRAEFPETMARVEEFGRRVVPGLEGIDHRSMGHMETLEFRQRVEGAKDTWRFPAINMSDGTLRAMALLISLFQPGMRGVPLVGIEEPETALHPAAAGILFDALRSATRQRQVIVTSHSPELLDHPSLRPQEILAITSVDGRTDIGPMDAASHSALRDHLYSGGELLRTGQLEPDRSAIPKPSQLRLFDSWDGA